MKNQINNNFLLYRLRSIDEIYVAVPNEYLPIIKNETIQYNSLENVPSEKTVRAIFAEKNNEEFTFDENGQQNDVLINQLIIL